MTSPRRVRRVLGFMGHGASQPILVECSDGSQFVLKYKNNRQGMRILVNEYVATQMAPAVRAPCPSSEILELPQELITVAELRVPDTDQLISAGLSFGSAYMVGAFDNPPAAIMATADNLDQAPAVVVLDTWTLNGNRTGNASNVIAYPVPDDPTTYRFAIIDQGHCFTGPGWTAGSLGQAADWIALEGNNPILQPGISGRDCFDDILRSLESIEHSDIRSTVDTIPQEWGVSAQERTALLDFLEVRRTKVREIIDMHFQ